ncbi:uncharacterized protein LOC131033887 isoform X2 [Cryptomeria japonica]|uniref:uncharacterized protein LOC131033887 isoform X2 n=1 Tax=Cryptomeria japonica TaxID=3369 RepID=UPI0027D9D38B|nr:uncharacterized protein LOC131033887 isoform X2 [Cryptomeria japonica]
MCGSSLHQLLSTSSVSTSLTTCPLAGHVCESLDVVRTAAKPTTEAAANLMHFVGHKVQKGECLYDISHDYNVDLRTLLKANPTLKNPDSLGVGSIIKIPYVENSSQCMCHLRYQMHLQDSLSTKPVTSVFTKPESFTLSKILWLAHLFLFKKRKHRVIEGDSLEAIAEKYDTTVYALKKLNNLNDDVIYRGSVLEVGERDLYKKHQFLIGKKADFHERSAILEHGPVNIRQLVSGSSEEIPLFCLYPLLQTAKGFKPPLPDLITVKVKSGDTLAHISCQHGLSIRELQRLNSLKDDVIIQGDVLVVSTRPEKMETMELRHGRRRTNRLLFSRQFLSKRSSLGVGGPESLGDATSISNGPELEGKWKHNRKGFDQRDKFMHFSIPLREGFLSSPFGWRWGAFHEGVDLAAEQGTPIYASYKGTVAYAGWNGGYGYLVAIQHEGGFVTRYAHCCAIHARVGQKVRKGQQVAAVGATGHATGPHLHFEVRLNGEALDPFKWVPL